MQQKRNWLILLQEHKFTGLTEDIFHKDDSCVMISSHLQKKQGLLLMGFNQALNPQTQWKCVDEFVVYWQCTQTGSNNDQFLSGRPDSWLSCSSRFLPPLFVSLFTASAPCPHWVFHLLLVFLTAAPPLLCIFCHSQGLCIPMQKRCSMKMHIQTSNFLFFCEVLNTFEIKRSQNLTDNICVAASVKSHKENLNQERKFCLSLSCNHFEDLWS